MSREAFTQVLASLAAAISLLERGGKKAAASDRMFEQMLDDYRAALEAGRNALSAVIADRDNYKSWYDDAMDASNIAGFAGMSAAQVIEYQDKEVERLRKEVSIHRAGADAWKFKHDQMKADRAACWAEFKALVKSSMDNEKYLNEQIDSLRTNAERYQWLRAQTWNTSPLCVVTKPKESVKLGYDCPFGERLDVMIDAELENPDVSPA